MLFTKEQLERFASPISQTEEQQCKNAINMVRNALKLVGYYDRDSDISPIYNGSYAYQIRMGKQEFEIRIFIQGSYANKTNIRAESDVDIAVVMENSFETLYRRGITDSVYNFHSVPSTFRQFKQEIMDALIRCFGSDDVERHNKSIHVQGNTYRKDADVVPCLRYRNYTRDYRNDPENYIGGIVIKADDGTRIINYPEQHIKNGVIKNSNTSFRFKKMVRIVKNIRSIMEDNRYPSASNISSFLIESLLWNIPDAFYLKYSSLLDIFENIISFLQINRQNISSFYEINGIKKINDDNPNNSNICSAFVADLYGFFECPLINP